MKFSKICIVSLVLFTSTTLFAQQDDSDWLLLPDGLGVSNQLEYSYNIDNKTEIFENWLNIDYTKGIFSTGVRFEAFQPNDPDPSISRGKVRYADIAFKYASVELGDFDAGLKITAGNFYSLFGRGMILKSYEDRNIRVDNDLLGVKVEGNFENFYLTALTGSAANSVNERIDVLHAADLEYKGFTPVRLGVSYASNQPDIEGVARTRLTSFRIQPSVWNFDFYGEYGIKQNSDIQNSILGGEESMVGEAYYGSMNFYFDSFSLVGEYKHYDNFAFTSNDGTIYYNTPPSLRKEYTYQLLNRHPSPLNQSNERGFQFEANYNFSYETSLQVNYGVTETLPSSSFYQRVNQINVDVLTQLKEVYAQATHNWNENFTTIAAFGYNEELATNTKNIAPILENKFYFDDVNTIKLVLEHQQTTNRSTDEQYYTDVIAIEYLRSPKLSISFVTEIETKEPEEGRTVRRVWSFAQFGYKFGSHTDISLLIGSRQAGNICIGGVCRFEPAFQGVELKMLTRI